MNIDEAIKAGVADVVTGQKISIEEFSKHLCLFIDTIMKESGIDDPSVLMILGSVGAETTIVASNADHEYIKSTLMGVLVGYKAGDHEIHKRN